MKKFTFTIAMLALFISGHAQQKIEQTQKFVHHSIGNPYLPLWEHIPDGEPRVFEDPDNPGKNRVYIIGSHDLRYSSYCGPDIRMWSAPEEDLSSWRDEGAIFTYKIDGEWDVMYAPDLVEVEQKDGTKLYYLYPHSRGYNREAMVAVGKRPDGPFEPINLTPDGRKTIEGSILGFDPAVYVEKITDPKDPDFGIGYRAYGYWGFQKSSAAELDPKTMYSIRPGTEVIERLLPAGKEYGVIRDPEGTEFPAIFPGQDLGQFNFFEASSIRKIGNKYVTVYSGYSGPDYGIGSSNSTLRYAVADSPLGPWKIGGVVVDSRAPVLNEDGTAITTANSGHNTHGSILEINGQWYVFYHRPPRNFGFARQATVAPVSVEWDEKTVAQGGTVRITAYNPYLKNTSFTLKASNGNEYTGAEITSEGFHVFGLAPYQFYSAGYACYLSDDQLMQDSWDIWDNHMPITNIKDGNIIGYKYFGFEGLKDETLGIKPFEGAKKGNKTAFNLFITPKTSNSFKVNIWIDGPWDNEVWKGKKIGEITVPKNAKQSMTKYTVDVAKHVEGLKGKHAIYLTFEGNKLDALCDMTGIGFSSKTKDINYVAPPSVEILVNQEPINLPLTPVRSTNENGIVDYHFYETTHTVKSSSSNLPKVTASSSSPDVKITIEQASATKSSAVVRFDYKGVAKYYTVFLGNN